MLLLLILILLLLFGGGFGYYSGHWGPGVGYANPIGLILLILLILLIVHGLRLY